jgi:hypothetical protein
MIQIQKTMPKNLEKYFPINKEIEVKFVLDAEVSSINNKSVFLTDLEDLKTIECNLVYKNKILKIFPKKDLKPNSHYQFTIVGEKEGIKFINNSYLIKNHTYEFFTEDSINLKAPEIFYPTDMEIINSKKIEINFEKIKEAKYFLVEISKSNTFHVSELIKESFKVFNNPVEKSFISKKIDHEFKNGLYYLRVMSVKEKEVVNSKTNKIEKKETTSEWSSIIQFRIEIEEESEIEIYLETKNIEEKEAFFETKHTINKRQVSSLSSLLTSFPEDGSTNVNPTSIEKISLIFSSEINSGQQGVDKIYLVEEKN